MSKLDETVLGHFKSLMVGHLLDRAAGREREEEQKLEEMDWIWRNGSAKDRELLNQIGARCVEFLNDDGTVRDAEGLRGVLSQ